MRIKKSLLIGCLLGMGLAGLSGCNTGSQSSSSEKTTSSSSSSSSSQTSSSQSSSSQEAKVVFSLVEGGNVPTTMNAELGELFVIPSVNAKLGSEEVTADCSVLDSKGATVKVLRGKFKAEDAKGYTLKFSAIINDKTYGLDISVKVSDSQAPTFSIVGTSGTVALVGDSVAIPDCTVVDASSTELKANYTVKSPKNEDVTITDGAFVASEVGDYTITYTATNAAGNKGTSDFVITSKKGKLLNDFETVEDVGYCQFNYDKEISTDLSQKGNGVKINIKGAFPGDIELGYPQWKRISVPCTKADGTAYTWEEIQQFEGVQVYVYSSAANELGVTNKVWPIDAGKNTLYMGHADIVSGYEAAPNQYDENGYFLNLRYPTDGTFIVLDQMIGIYADDYVPTPIFHLATGEVPPKAFSADIDSTFTIPSMVATREGNPCVVTASATDSAGVAVSLTDNAFKVTDLSGYKITYTATIDGLSFTLEIPLNVVNIYIPTITIDNGANTSYVNEAYTIPGATVAYPLDDKLTYTTAVTGPDGAAVTVADGAFTPSATGVYTITYTSKVNDDLVGTATFALVVIAKTDYVMSSFDNAESVQWMPSYMTKEFLADGYKIGSTSKGSWIRACVPFYKSEGVFYTLDDVKNLSSLDMYVYSSNANSVGLSTQTKDVVAGENMISFSQEEILAAIAGSTDTYNADLNGFYFNMKASDPEQHLVLHSFIGHFVDGYDPLKPVETPDPAPVYPEGDTGVMINDFKEAADFVWAADAITREVVDYGIKISGTIAWGGLVMAMEKTYAEIQAYDYIEVYFYSTFASQLGLYNNGFKDFVAGQNKLQFTKADIAESEAAYPGKQYDASGFWFNLKALTAGEHITFYSIKGYGGTTEPADHVIINDFSATSSIAWAPGIYNVAKETDGVSLTVNTAAQWSNVVISLNKTYDELITYSRIEISLTVVGTDNLGLFSSDFTALNAGENTITFTKDQIVASQTTYPGKQYDASGFWLMFKAPAVGNKYTFHSVTAYK